MVISLLQLMNNLNLNPMRSELLWWCVRWPMCHSDFSQWFKPENWQFSLILPPHPPQHLVWASLTPLTAGISHPFKLSPSSCYSIVHGDVLSHHRSIVCRLPTGFATAIPDSLSSLYRSVRVIFSEHILVHIQMLSV